MLPPFIIEQIRKREQEEQARHEQPQLELPLPPRREREPKREADDEPNRGVIILDLMGD
jgi:hypothetical protein